MSEAAVQCVRVGDVPFGGEHGFALIAGPCVIEGRDHALRHADATCGNADTRGQSVAA